MPRKRRRDEPKNAVNISMKAWDQISSNRISLNISSNTVAKARRWCGPKIRERVLADALLLFQDGAQSS